MSIRKVSKFRERAVYYVMICGGEFHSKVKLAAQASNDDVASDLTNQMKRIFIRGFSSINTH